ncbi:MAG: DNA polymerase III subunit delta' [Proteobacteria bacterium]|nr:DNA polymerase III subunit delta' [Pseudomonadota bacterium]MBU2226276.1 DNA polymerase III subunit delta' [Pseudomonadota bacterium]MBU2261494.1 DNA polymerase III subunit delta' [Pseudomonadota bacterium]
MTFGEIYGHERPIAILKSAMGKNRIAHAYLFYGMEGVGKRTTAAVFAQALNCDAKDPPCDACLSCRKAKRNNHIDIITVRAEGQFIKIGAVKELQEQIKFRPYEGLRRVFILPEADRMNAPAANALLKTLEEPSAGNILLLTTSRPHALPMTILSRCQHFRFTPLSRQEVARFLREKEGLDAAAAEVLAASSGGSIGRAREMNREDYLVLRNGILEHLAEDGPADPLKRLAFAGRFGTEREEVVERLRILRSCYRDALVLRETEEEERLLFRDRAGTIRVIAGRLPGRELLANIAAVEAAISAIERNANKSLTLEALMVKLT